MKYLFAGWNTHNKGLDIKAVQAKQVYSFQFLYSSMFEFLAFGFIRMIVLMIPGVYFMNVNLIEKWSFQILAHKEIAIYHSNLHSRTWPGQLKKVKHSTESATLRRFLGEEKLAVITHLYEKMLKFQIFWNRPPGAIVPNHKSSKAEIVVLHFTGISFIDYTNVVHLKWVTWFQMSLNQEILNGERIWQSRSNRWPWWLLVSEQSS